jgi:hypothetical protein
MPPEENAAPPSIADSLAAAIDTVESKDTAPAAEGSPVAETPPAKPDAAPDKPPVEGRDRAGRFVPKKDAPPPDAPASDAAPTKAAPAATVPVSGAVPAKADTPAAGPADGAPQSWKDDVKAKWEGLDPQVKSEIARREREITVGLQRAAETRKFGDSVMQEFAPYAEILSKEGASPQAAIRALLETSYTLRYGSQEHKHALFMSLAEQYGIDLTKPVDPEKARLQWEIDSRKHEDLRGGAQQQANIQREVQQELEAFIEAPGHEHYATVRTTMAGLLQSGTAKDLQDAYDQACWANPTLRAAMQQADALKRAAEQGKNRNALATVTGAPGAVSTGAPAVDVKSLRSVIESQFGGGRV